MDIEEYSITEVSQYIKIQRRENPHVWTDPGPGKDEYVCEVSISPANKHPSWLSL